MSSCAKSNFSLPYSQSKPDVFLECLSVPFLVIPRAPTISDTMVVLRCIFSIFFMFLYYLFYYVLRLIYYSLLALTYQIENVFLLSSFDGNYPRILWAILNKSWRPHPTKQQLYGHLPLITKTIKVRRTRHAGNSWRSRYELIRDVLLWIPIYGRAKTRRPVRTYIQSRFWRPARGDDERQGEVVKEGQWYLCWRHDMMMMMIALYFTIGNRIIVLCASFIIFTNPFARAGYDTSAV